MITAVIVEGRSQGEVARAYGVSQGWVSRLVARYRDEGEAAFEPRSRRPKTSPSAVSAQTAGLITGLRTELGSRGLDAGPDTICWHLEHHHQIRVSAATVSRYLARAGLVTPEPAKRPKSSCIRFEAELPNQCWQADFTHYPLADDTGTEILSWLDDHSRYALRVAAHRRATGHTVVSEFRAAAGQHGIPASTLTGNGMVFTTRLSGGRGGRNAFEHELRRLGITQKNGKPSHPQTQGKAERFQQMKNWLRAQPHQPATLAELQSLLDVFASYCNAPSGRTARCPAGPPQRPSTTQCPKTPPAPAATTTPTTASAATASTTPARSPCAPPAGCTTSASAAPTPGPASSSSSRTGTSASSTPPPANCSASSPPTRPGTTSPPGRPRASPQETGNPDPDEGSGSFRCLERSHGAPGRIRTRDPLLRRQPLCPLSYRRSVTHCA